MLPFLVLTALVGLGLSMDISVDDGGEDQDDSPVDIDRLERTNDFADVIGSNASNLLTGTDSDNTIRANGGDDLVLGGEGNDTIYGGTGDDTLYGGAGEDHVIGDTGDDLLILGAGDDVVDTPLGSSELVGDDTINGGAGDDVIADADGSNVMRGDAGDDLLIAVDGATANGAIGTAAERFTTDTLEGGTGDDTLLGDNGDEMTGGEGADNFLIGTTFATPVYDADAVIVKDFDVQEDVLMVTFFDLAGAEADVSFAYDSDKDGVRASVLGRDVALLEGLSEADIPRIEVVNRI